LQKAGAIRRLKLQQRFKLQNVKGEDVGVYVIDFLYEEKQDARWVLVGEDVKGEVLALYRLKAALFVAQYPHIEFREIKTCRN